MGPNRFSDIVRHTAIGVGIDPLLLGSICEVESSWDPWACRFEPNFSYFDRTPYFADLNHITEPTERQLQSQSYGLGQIMGATARGAGYRGPLGQLYDPETNLVWVATVLHRLVEKYVVQEDVIASYNAGSPKPGKDGSRLFNQGYVNRVLAVMARGMLL